MNLSNILFLLVVFGVVGGVAALAISLFSPGYVRGRLASFRGKAEPTALENNGWVEKVVRVAQPFSKLSLPDEGWSAPRCARAS